jgi:cell division protein ZapA (FtsZ GTPase activity inhibitor)
MTSRDFVYFLQGFFEINEPQTINKQQVEIIKNHLNLVFKHEIDPSLNEGKVDVKMTIQKSSADAINELRVQTGSTNNAEVIVASINLIRDLKSKVANGAKIIIENADGTRQRLTI